MNAFPTIIFPLKESKPSIVLEAVFLCYHQALLVYGKHEPAARSVNLAAQAFGLTPIFPLENPPENGGAE